MSESRIPSADLRKAGQIIADIGKAIEDSQVEDGDPPFPVSKKQFHELLRAIEIAQKAKDNLTFDINE